MKCLRLAVLALALPGSWLSGAEESLVALPPFLVEEASKGPPWRYAEAPGYEILSRCNDAVTRRVVATHQRLHQLLAEVLPPSLQLQCTVPRTLILYDEELQPAASREVIARLLQEDSLAAPPPEDFASSGGLRGFRTPPPPPRRLSFLPNLRLWDRDAMSVFMIVRRDDFDAERLALTADYISFLVKGRLPSLPAWFVGGFLTLYGQMHYEGERLTLDPIEWIAPAHTAAVKKDPKTAPPVQPLADFFALQTVPPAEALAYDPLKAWQSQAALFVRWGLEADGGAHREALWKFTERSAQRGASEPLFVECFGFDFATAHAQLTAYLPVAVKRDVVFRLHGPKPAPIVLRPATDGDIARLKGDWERLEVPYVKKISPALAPKYLEQARRTFRRAYDRDVRDPRLLAAMGLCEVDAGDDVAAREFLEAAVVLGPLRPRALCELARLRLAAARAQFAASGAQLDISQVAEILKLLFAARAAEPPLPEAYELIADIWAISSAKATRGHLAVLDEGIRLFPRRPSLVLRAAEVNLRHGFGAEATVLAEVADKLVRDEADRARLAALRIAIERAGTNRSGRE